MDKLFNYINNRIENQLDKDLKKLESNIEKTINKHEENIKKISIKQKKNKEKVVRKFDKFTSKFFVQNDVEYESDESTETDDDGDFNSCSSSVNTQNACFMQTSFNNRKLKEIRESAEQCIGNGELDKLSINKLKQILFDDYEEEPIIGNYTIIDIEQKLINHYPKPNSDVLLFPIWRIKYIFKNDQHTASSQFTSYTNNIGNEKQLTKDEDLCKICMENTIDCVLIECGHLVTCYKCSDGLRNCPICRKTIKKVIKTYKS